MRRYGPPGERSLRRQSGFTLFELVIVVVVAAFLATVFFKRFLIYQEIAEKASMQQTAGAIKAGLTVQMAGLIARGRMDDIPRLATINPIKVLNELPQNYFGEHYDPARGFVPEGSWYFDLKSKELVYVVKRGEHFESDENGDKLVRYRIKLVKNELFGVVDRDDLAGVTLELAQPYRWNVE